MKKYILLIFYVLAWGHTWAQDSSDPDYYYLKGESQRKSKKYFVAIEYYEKALDLDPDNHKYYYGIGQCYTSLKQYDEAEKALLELLKHQDKFVKAHVLLAKVYKGDKQYDKMVHSYDKAFTYDGRPDRKIKYATYIVKDLLKREKYHDLLKYASKGLSVEGHNITFLHAAAVSCNHSHHYDKALSYAKKAVAQLAGEKDPQKVAKYYYELGYAYNKTKQYEKANDAFKYAKYGKYRALVDRMSPQYYCDAARLYMDIYRYDYSKKMIHHAVKLQHSNIDAHIILAEIANKSRHSAEAIHQYKKAAELEKSEGKRMALYKIIIEDQLNGGHYADVITYADKVLTVEHSNYAVMYWKAVAQYRSHHHKEAIVTMETLVTNSLMDSKTRSKYYFALGLMYKDAKMSKDAMTCFKKAIASNYKKVAKYEIDELKDGPKIP